MALPNKDEVRGQFRKAKGDIKEKVGRATNDPEMIRESRDDKASGRGQETYEKARRKVGEVVEDVGEAIRK